MRFAAAPIRNIDDCGQSLDLPAGFRGGSLVGLTRQEISLGPRSSSSYAVPPSHGKGRSPRTTKNPRHGGTNDAGRLGFDPPACAGCQ